MSIRLIWPFLQLWPIAQQRELAAQLQAELGVDARTFRDPEARVSTHIALDLLDRSSDALDQPNIGLLASQHVTSEHLGIAEYIARASSSLGDALRSCDRYIPLLCGGAHQHTDVRGGRAYVRIWFDSNLLASAAADEFALAVQLAFARRITGLLSLTPLEVHFRHAQPHNLALHREIFRCALHFDQRVTQLVLAADQLALKPTAAEPGLNSLLKRHAEELLIELPRAGSLVEQVREMLFAEVEPHRCNATQLSRRLGMSVRNFARRLRNDGTSFRELLNERRKYDALSGLAQTSLPIHEIARQLGFAKPQSFHRAFRRWTGESATRFRQRSRRRELMN